MEALGKGAVSYERGTPVGAGVHPGRRDGRRGGLRGMGIAPQP
jgi:hypothetical protein